MNRYLPFLCSAIVLAAFGQSVAYMISDRTPQYYAPLTQAAAVEQAAALQNSSTLASDMTQMAHASAAIHDVAIIDPGLSIPALPPALPSAAITPQTQALDTAAPYPPPLNSLANAVTYIEGQRYPLADGAQGLPLTFYTPPSLDGQILNNNADSDRIIRQGTGLYDTSLAIMAMVESGNLAESQSMIDMYVKGTQGQFGTPGTYGSLDLWAEPNFNGHNNGGAFFPFGVDPKTGQETFYLFDFTRADGVYTTDWSYFAPHTGPNAWLILAISQYINAKGKSDPSVQPYLDFIQKIGNGMLALQNPNLVNPPGDTSDYGSTQGCVRYSPLGTYDPTGTNPFMQCNTENNMSAYAAYNSLYALTGDTRYKTAATSIASWLQNATVYEEVPQATVQSPSSPSQNSVRRPIVPPSRLRDVKLKGMMDPTTGMFYKQILYNPRSKHWEVQMGSDGKPILATDSGGTWSISSLGPQTIDNLFGQGAAYRMWASTRDLMGRTATTAANGTISSMKDAGATGRLDGLDFSDLYPENESLISPEWTAGGINAVKQLLLYYRDGSGKNQLTSAQIAGLSADQSSMQAFISANSNSYAVGPGLTGSRAGQTGFNWIAPPLEDTAMASIYGDLTVDPLASVRP